MRRLLALLLAALVTAGLAAAAEAATTALPTGTQTYDIFRNGEKIGTQINEFIHDGNRLTVRTRMDIAVQLLFVTAYRFTLEEEETWEDGELVAMRTRANDDGKRKVVDLQRDDTADPRIVRINYNGKNSTLPAGVMPASFWHPDTVEQTEFVDVLNGKRRDVIITPRGTETLTIGGQKITARRYAMRGEIERDLWYGPDSQLLQVRFPAEDGSLVTIIKTAP